MLNNLPIPILEHIMSYLPMEDLGRLRRVNHATRASANTVINQRLQTVPYIPVIARSKSDWDWFSSRNPTMMGGSQNWFIMKNRFLSLPVNMNNMRRAHLLNKMFNLWGMNPNLDYEMFNREERLFLMGQFGR